MVYSRPRVRCRPTFSSRSAVGAPFPPNQSTKRTPPHTLKRYVIPYVCTFFFKSVFLPFPLNESKRGRRRICKIKGTLCRTVVRRLNKFGIFAVPQNESAKRTPLKVRHAVQSYVSYSSCDAKYR